MNDPLLTTLQQATEPSRELDARIHAECVVGWPQWHWYTGYQGGKEQIATINDDGVLFSSNVPHYTSNLQDALELVPEGWSCSITQDDNRLWWAELRRGYQTSFTDVAFSTRRPSPALALATAAIEARVKLREAA